MNNQEVISALLKRRDEHWKDQPDREDIDLYRIWKTRENNLWGRFKELCKKSSLEPKKVIDDFYKPQTPDHGK